MRELLHSLINDTRVRYLFVGGINTLLSTGLFVVLSLTFGDQVLSVVPLSIAWIISLVAVFFVHRSVVFRVRGHMMRDFERFFLVNVGSLVVNIALLTLASDVLKFPRIPAQIVITIVTVVGSFIGHKYFSFRRQASDSTRVDS